MLQLDPEDDNSFQGFTTLQATGPDVHRLAALDHAVQIAKSECIEHGTPIEAERVVEVATTFADFLDDVDEEDLEDDEVPEAQRARLLG